MKLLVFTLHFWLKGLRGINNDKKDNKCHNKNARKTASVTQDQIEFEI